MKLHSQQPKCTGPVEGAAEETQVTEIKNGVGDTAIWSMDPQIICEYIGQLHTSNLVTRIVGRKFQIGHTFKTQAGRTKELEQTFNYSQD